MATVNIGSQDYTTYASLAAADAYLAASTHAANWTALGDDTDAKGKALVTATRVLERQQWATAYNTFALREAEENIVNASIELALALVDGSEVQTQPSTEERVRSISAGSVSITNFWNGTTATRFPQIVQELLRGYLGGSGTFGAGVVAGVDDESIFPIDLGFNAP